MTWLISSKLCCYRTVLQLQYQYYNLITLHNSISKHTLHLHTLHTRWDDRTASKLTKPCSYKTVLQLHYQYYNLITRHDSISKHTLHLHTLHTRWDGMTDIIKASKLTKQCCYRTVLQLQYQYYNLITRHNSISKHPLHLHTGNY